MNKTPATEPPSQPNENTAVPTHPSRLASYLDLFLRMLDTTCLIDTENFKILDINDAGEKFFKEPPEALQTKVLTDWLIPEDHESFRKNLRIARRRYYPREWDSWMKIGEKRVAVRISACMLRLSNEKDVIQMIIRDTTKEVESAQEIQRYIGELEVLNKKLEALSTTDEMTKLNNFRHFRNQLLSEHARAQRYNGTYALIFFDVDHFKHYNDRNGHPAGDKLLQQLATIIKLQCRDTDTPARYGGEEFIILCPATPWKNAMILAERVRETIAKHSFEFGEFQPLGKLSVSIGVSSYPSDGDSADEVLEAADQALYHSKQQGRNCSHAYRTLQSNQNKKKTDSGEQDAA